VQIAEWNGPSLGSQKIPNARLRFPFIGHQESSGLAPGGSPQHCSRDQAARLPSSTGGNLSDRLVEASVVEASTVVEASVATSRSSVLVFLDGLLAALDGMTLLTTVAAGDTGPVGGQGAVAANVT
jgi:hypothetical protein